MFFTLQRRVACIPYVSLKYRAANLQRTDLSRHGHDGKPSRRPERGDNEIRAAETSRELQPNKSSSTPSKKLSEADPEDMNKKFLEALAKELSLTPEAIAKMFGDYHLNCTRRRANEREQILTLRSKNHFQSWNARERPFWHWQRPNDGS